MHLSVASQRWRVALLLASTSSRARLRSSLSPNGMSDEFARIASESGLLRPAAVRDLESGTLWDGITPQPSRSPEEVIGLT